MIVVGIDGSDNSWRALEWAGAEAERTSDTITVAHAGDLKPDGSEQGDFAHALLCDAIARSADNHPTVVVRTKSDPRDAESLLVELSREADVVVIGQSGAGRIARLFVGSTAQHILAHAHSPVVVIGEQLPAADGEVVVGVSVTEGGLAAMRFACAAARTRNATVRAVRAWTDESWTLIGATTGISTFDEWERCEGAMLDKWLSQARAEFPDVHIDGELASTPVYWELEKFATSAALLVLGCRRTDEAPAARLGPIATWAVRVAACPVAIVGHQRVSTPQIPEPVPLGAGD